MQHNEKKDDIQQPHGMKWVYAFLPCFLSGLRHRQYFNLSDTNILVLTGCTKSENTLTSDILSMVESNMKTYYKMSDGTWQAERLSYQYRLEISGGLSNAKADSTFVFLSSFEKITFE